MGGTGFAEGGTHDRAGDAAVGGDREAVAGVVVEPVENLDMGAISYLDIVATPGRQDRQDDGA
jgi:hypothetical protein